MASVALIGPDGAGKTTLTRMLEESGLRPFKYIYMGIDIPASNIALPTSRLVEKIKARRSRGEAGKWGATPRGKTEASPHERAAPARRMETSAGRAARRRGIGRTLWALARLANRLADEWYRQSVSWLYQRRGFTVLYDRHFAFDFALDLSDRALEPLDRQIHRWCLSHLYPLPDLVIFLDAPGELLFARKGELTVEELERRRQAFLKVGRGMPGFRRVDAARPLQEVYAEVCRHIVRLNTDARPAVRWAR